MSPMLTRQPKLYHSGIICYFGLVASPHLSAVSSQVLIHKYIVCVVCASIFHLGSDIPICEWPEICFVSRTKDGVLLPSCFGFIGVLLIHHRGSSLTSRVIPDIPARPVCCVDGCASAPTWIFMELDAAVVGQDDTNR